jgi:hypothetical protein
MNQKMKECMTPHALLHTLTGIGVGLILAGLSPGIYGMAVTLGVVLTGLGIVGEFFRKPEKA